MVGNVGGRTLRFAEASFLSRPNGDLKFFCGQFRIVVEEIGQTFLLFSIKKKVPCYFYFLFLLIQVW